jgi:hypothetical protein
MQAEAYDYGEDHGSEGPPERAPSRAQEPRERPRELRRLPEALWREKLRLDALGGAAAFPYDPREREYELRDLDKLRAVRDRGIARALYELFWITEANAHDPSHAAFREREAQRKRDEELQWMAGVAERALKGDFGPTAKTEAEDVLLTGWRGQMRTDEASLRECVKRVQAVRT